LVQDNRKWKKENYLFYFLISNFMNYFPISNNL